MAAHQPTLGGRAKSYRQAMTEWGRRTRTGEGVRGEWNRTPKAPQRVSLTGKAGSADLESRRKLSNDVAAVFTLHSHSTTRQDAIIGGERYRYICRECGERWYG